MSITIREIEWQNDREKVLGLERAYFPENVASDAADLSSQLRQGFGFIAVDDANHALGYVIAKPLESANYAGCNDDAFKGRNDTAYIESFAEKSGSAPAVRLGLFRVLGNTFAEKGFSRVTMHAETDSVLHKAMTSFGARQVKTFPDFMGWGKPYTYLEMPLA